jgi:hypothetical protein
VFAKYKTLSRPRRWVTVLAPLAAATAFLGMGKVIHIVK